MPLSRLTSNSISTSQAVQTFSTANTERMRIDANGNIGIGTTTPQSKLEIDTGSDGTLLRTRTTGTQGWIQLIANNDISKRVEVAVRNNGNYGALWADGDRLVWDRNGNIGIGTTSPGYRLDAVSADASGYAVRVRSSTSATKARIQFTNNGATQENGYIECGDTQYLAFITAASERMRIDSSGRIYGTSQPTFFASGPGSNQLLSNGADLQFNIAIVNIGNCFNTSNYRFTAPIAGRYLLSFHLFCQETTGRVFFKKNGGNISGLQSQNVVNSGLSATIIVTLAANDYVTVGEWQNLGGGTYYMGHSSFSGTLIL